MNDNEIIQQYKKYEPFFGSWYLKRFIGEGAFAKVFEIVRNDFGKEYVSALKVITISKTRSEIDTLRSEGMTDGEIKDYLKGFVEDTVREIQLMYELKGNGNIVAYEDHAVMEHEDGMGWDILIKMEYLTSLNAYIRQNKGSLPKQDVIRLGVDICKAMEFCQKYNIIHRDIKADNIFVAKSGEFKLGDFGIARVIERKDQTLSKKGTSAYMAPEVYKGQTYTSVVDIYSLGIVLYRLLNNNRAPFLPEYPKPISLDDRDRSLMMRMSGEKFPVPGQAGKSRLTEIVLKACAYRPEERYSSPMFMRQELEAILLDQDEVTAEEIIMIYEEDRRDTASSRQSISAANSSPEPTAATEVLREEATEVLREEDGTPLGDISVVPGEAEVKVLCKKCGNAINHDSSFCSVCGSSQREKAKPALRRKTPKEKTKPASTRKTPKEQSKGKNAKKLMLPGGICAAVLLIIAVFIGIWSTSTSKPPAKKIITITFLDTLDDMPESAWAAPEFGSGEVMAWAKVRKGGYDLYIGAEGGVVANEECQNLFTDYTNVEQIYFNGNFDTSNVTNMVGMFENCSHLTAVDVNDFNTSNVKYMSLMFKNCSGLTSVDISGFDTSKLIFAVDMFKGCTSLTQVKVRNFTSVQIERMGLSSLDIVEY